MNQSTAIPHGARTPDNPHPLSGLKTELVWEGKYDEDGRRVANLAEVDQATYERLHGLVRRDIIARHKGAILPVQWDDLHWRKLNR
jgi:hypothetical protein